MGDTRTRRPYLEVAIVVLQYRFRDDRQTLSNKLKGIKTMQDNGERRWLLENEGLETQILKEIQRKLHRQHVSSWLTAYEGMTKHLHCASVEW